MDVTSMIRIRREYQLRKPLPTVMRKIFSGSGRRPWPSCVMNGYVAAASSIVMIAPRHHAPFGLTEASPGSGCTALEKNGVVSSSSITAMSDATAASMAISTSASFVMAT